MVVGHGKQIKEKGKRRRLKATSTSHVHIVEDAWKEVTKKILNKHYFFLPFNFEYIFFSSPHHIYYFSLFFYISLLNIHLNLPKMTWTFVK